MRVPEDFKHGEEQALTMGLVAHSVQFVSVTIIGMILFFAYKRIKLNIKTKVSIAD